MDDADDLRGATPSVTPSPRKPLGSAPEKALAAGGGPEAREASGGGRGLELSVDERGSSERGSRTQERREREGDRPLQQQQPPDIHNNLARRPTAEGTYVPVEVAELMLKNMEERVKEREREREREERVRDMQQRQAQHATNQSAGSAGSALPRRQPQVLRPRDNKQAAPLEQVWGTSLLKHKYLSVASRGSKLPQGQVSSRHHPQDKNAQERHVQDRHVASPTCEDRHAQDRHVASPQVLQVSYLPEAPRGSVRPGAQQGHVSLASQPEHGHVSPPLSPRWLAASQFSRLGGGGGEVGKGGPEGEGNNDTQERLPVSTLDLHLKRHPQPHQSPPSPSPPTGKKRLNINVLTGSVGFKTRAT
jgi:hypothetical protein